ncbi:DNA glycosylase AlkZ-like family protein [Alteromonas sp. W364]|uniref:winged helix-turn-helix domain-containing protein n=1 Tax=Alteromonas sp. W364 TaxID=3075610 RepID=UPI0028875A56|nr:crosslink repair DNA glycosylase YcaQ family protein [Alteromonas sp. W364]MDT0629329.1 crosslink repair DNA glycosylase YcaQ family protein [Alteromonas sp. W364]
MTKVLRRLALQTQGLARKPAFSKGLQGTLQAIEHLGYVQIDTISVIERAHHHILWSRVPDYQPSYLNELVANKQVFEYWYHAAAYLPMRDYRFALPAMEDVRNNKNRYYNGTDPSLLKSILARIEQHGPTRLRDIEKQNENTGDWWNMGPSRRAFERLFMQGDIMICAREGMEKVFDLRERCLPDNIDLSMPSVEEYAKYLFENTMKAHGIFTKKQLLHLKTGKPIRDAMQAIIDTKLRSGEIESIQNKNHPDTYHHIENKAASLRFQNTVKVLSPFDNVLIHRDRLNALFGFDYKLECYVPPAKRQYGYFTLPVLFGDRFVARIDCKAHRKLKQLEVISLHLENGQLASSNNEMPGFMPKLIAELERFAKFNNCDSIKYPSASFAI